MSAEEDPAAAAAAFLAAAGGGSGGGSVKKKKNKKKGKQAASEAQTDAQTDAKAALAEDANEVDGDEDDGDGKYEGHVDDEQARIMAQLGISADGGDGGGKKKKKKKKKPAAKAKEDKDKDEPSSAVAKLALERLEHERHEAERQNRREEEQRRREEEEEKTRLEEERREQEARELKKQKEKERKERLRAEGKPVTKAERQRHAKAAEKRQKLIAAGILKVDEDGNIIEPGKVAKAKSVHGNKKKAQSQDSKTETPKEKVEEEEEVQVPKEGGRDAEEGKEIDGQQELEEGGQQEDEQQEDATMGNEENDAEPQTWDVVADVDDWESAVVEQLDEHLAANDEEVVVEEEMVKKTPATTANDNTSGKKGNKKGGKKKGKAKVKGAHEESGSSLTGAEQVRLKELEKEREIEEARERREERMREALKRRTKDDLRSPICVVMGHVDTGKTKLLDKIRRTNVQEGEAGGITQQIGATYFPMENLKKTTDKLNKDLSLEYKVPGLLMIDTPGHESFANLRKRGANLTDIAVIVIDIMHGLEQQTIESINILRKTKTPFIVALNKIDRLFGWKAAEGSPIRDSLAQQDDNVMSEFETRTKQVITQLMEQGLNASLYYENKDFKRVVSLVPTSAHSGEGIPDLLLLLIQLTQRMMVERLMFSDVAEATVLDVKKIEGVGTTIDVILVNGKLRKGEMIIVAGMNGPIVTQVRALLTPQPLKEMRVKGEFVHHDELKAAIGVKIAAPNLEEAIAGTSMMVQTEEDDVEELMDTVMEDVQEVMSNVSTTGRGVCVQASTLGSLEALMEFLRTSEIPVASVAIGTVHKKDVNRASVMLEHQKEFACILAFDVKVSRDAEEMAEELGVRIFTAEIIYHLFDHFTKYLEDMRKQRKSEIEAEAVFPCVLRILGEHVYMKRNPLVFGVDVVDGICKVGTPIVVPGKQIPDDDNPGSTKPLELGKIVSIEKDGTAVDRAKRGSAVAIKIQGNSSQAYVTYGRHFDHEDALYSKLTRKSIDLLKENFKDELQKTDWQLVIKLKSVFNIS